MADPTWEETTPLAAAPATDVPKWEETVPTDAPTQSPVTAATTGFLNAGMGVGPTLGALGSTAMDAVTGTNGPLNGGSIQDLIDEYHQKHQQIQDEFAKAAAAHPKIATAGNIAGGAATLAPFGAAAVSPAGLAATGAVAGFNQSPDIQSIADLPPALANAGKGAAMNLAAGTAMKAAAPYVGKALAPVGAALSSAAGGISDALGNSAENLAVKATGATAAQSQKFADDTGRQLLDRGVVNFGSSPADIAQNANAAMDSAEAAKSDIIQNQLGGTTVDRNTVYNYIRSKIADLSGNESQVGLVNNLESKLEDIAGVADETGSEVPLAKSEEIRRGYDKAAKWNKATDAADAEANKIVAGAYREAGENAATAANPDLGSAFKEAKDTQHLLIPVADAAERRSAQLNQNPVGGLLDVTTGLAGAAAGGAPGAAAALIAKRVLTPRLASMGAVSADQLSSVFARAPEAFGKFSGVLKSAAARGSASLGATDYLLQQTNQEYREQRNKVFNPTEEDLLINRSPDENGP